MIDSPNRKLIRNDFVTRPIRSQQLELMKRHGRSIDQRWNKDTSRLNRESVLPGDRSTGIHGSRSHYNVMKVRPFVKLKTRVDRYRIVIDRAIEVM